MESSKGTTHCAKRYSLHNFMAAALFPTSCQYIAKLLSLKISTTDFFLRRFSSTPKKRRVPAQCCTAGWFAREGCKGQHWRHRVCSAIVTTQPGTTSQAQTPPAGTPSILTMRPCLPENTRHALPCAGGSLCRNQNPKPPLPFLPPFPCQLSVPKAISAHSRQGLCLPPPPATGEKPPQSPHRRKLLPAKQKPQPDLASHI